MNKADNETTPVAPLASIDLLDRPPHQWTFQRLRRNLVQGCCSCGLVVHDKTTRVVVQKLKEHEIAV
jgi:hypothetical protein